VPAEATEQSGICSGFPLIESFASHRRATIDGIARSFVVVSRAGIIYELFCLRAEAEIPDRHVITFSSFVPQNPIHSAALHKQHQTMVAGEFY
jgi:hypothetical protein